MAKEPKKHPVRTLFGLLLLGAICIGATELSIARLEDPVLYESVTAPAREAYEDARVKAEAYAAERAAELEAERQRRAEERRRQELERLRQSLAQDHQREQERLFELAELDSPELEAALAAQFASAPTIREELLHADPTITEFITENGHEVLTGGNVSLVYFNQGDEAWATQRFGPDSIGGYGCGPTALAMVLASTVDKTATPANVAAWAASSGYCSPRNGSALSIVGGAAAHYGLDYTPLGALDADTLYATLAGGGVIVALMGPGHFTGRGHFILLHGVTLSGGIIVADPNSRDNSLAVWDPQVIVNELSRSRHDGAPLWLLSEPLAL